jgi:tRNA(His) 5'-end guanylyltransferase
MSSLMVATTKELVEESGACIGYTQSDEISLVFYSPSYDSQVFFNGRKQKMVSVLAAMCSVTFNDLYRGHFGSDANSLALFDCRAWQVPSLVEAANALLWREQDATKNAISMAARHYYSHKSLHGKSGKEMQELLFQKGINFNDYPAFFKRGTFVRREVKVRKFSTKELCCLPEKHAARKNPDLMVERTDVVVMDMPKFSTVINRVSVVFSGEKPLTKRESVVENS